MRTSETHYFNHGFIKFFKDKGIDYFTVYVYDQSGENLSSVRTGKLKDKEQLQGLLSARNAEEFFGLQNKESVLQ